MLGKKPKPVIDILTGSFISGTRSGSTSPKSPRTFDIGAVGLSIVAELEKTSADLLANRALFNRNLSRSIPIPVNNTLRNNSEYMDTESSYDEEYTIVTCHGQNNSYSKVYGRKGSPFRIREEPVVSRNKKPSVFHISPPRAEDISFAPPSDFLSSCVLCDKKLHNEDIYMYRGEKAFCSTECRFKQIMADEVKEKYSNSETSSMRAPVAGSPYTTAQIFTAGILAT